MPARSLEMLKLLLRSPVPVDLHWHRSSGFRLSRRLSVYQKLWLTMLHRRMLRSSLAARMPRSSILQTVWNSVWTVYVPAVPVPLSTRWHPCSRQTLPDWIHTRRTMTQSTRLQHVVVYSQRLISSHSSTKVQRSQTLQHLSSRRLSTRRSVVLPVVSQSREMLHF